MYTEKRLELLKVGASAPDNLSVANVAAYSYAVLSPCTVDCLRALVTTVLVGAAVVVLKRRPLLGSAAGESILATVNIPGGTLAGQTLQKKFKPEELDVGDELIFEVTSAATSGAALYGVEVDNDPEEAANNPELSDSL